MGISATASFWHHSSATHKVVMDGSGKVPHRHNFRNGRGEVFTINGWQPESSANYTHPLRIKTVVATLPVNAPIKGQNATPMPDNSKALKEALKEVSELKPQPKKLFTTKTQYQAASSPQQPKPVTPEKPAAERAEEAAAENNQTVMAALKKEHGVETDEDLHDEIYDKIPGLRFFLDWWKNRGSQDAATDTPSPNSLDEGPDNQ